MHAVGSKIQVETTGVWALRCLPLLVVGTGSGCGAVRQLGGPGLPAALRTALYQRRRKLKAHEVAVEWRQV